MIVDGARQSLDQLIVVATLSALVSLVTIIMGLIGSLNFVVWAPSAKDAAFTRGDDRRGVHGQFPPAS